MSKDPIHEQALFAERILRSITADQAEAIRSRFGALGIELVARCAQCDRVLDQPHDPLLDWSRGECAGCVVEFETGKVAPDLPDDELRAFVQPFLQAYRELSAMIDRALAKAGLTVKDSDPAEIMIVIGTQRFLQQGLAEDEARARTVENFSHPWPAHWPKLPSIEELGEP